MHKIKSPLRYPGGKSRVAEQTIAFSPEFAEYREPFLGGGSVFVSMKQNRPDASFWINDLYTDLYCFWKGTQTCSNQVISLVRGWKDSHHERKELYTYLINNIQTMSDIEKAAAFFILNHITFSGTTMSGGYSPQCYQGRFIDASIKKVSTVAPLLENVTITNEDYAEVLQASGENVFIFMDPPYYSATKSTLYGYKGNLHKGFDHVRFPQEAKNCKHKWLIIYDDCEFIRGM